jgi:hypothetical protein
MMASWCKKSFVPVWTDEGKNKNDSRGWKNERQNRTTKIWRMRGEDGGKTREKREEEERRKTIEKGRKRQNSTIKIRRMRGEDGGKHAKKGV